MATRQPEVAVAFTIRHRFSWTMATLRRLYAHAEVPFRLYCVDGGYPPAARQQLESFLADKDNVVWLAAPRFIYPNEALNLALSRVAEPYVLLLQNDALLDRHALGSALETIKRLGADVVSPEVLDNVHGAPAPHHESSMALGIQERADGVWVGLESSPEEQAGYRRLRMFEMHCLLMKVQALRAAGPLLPFNVHEHIDLALTWWKHDRSIFLDPASRVLVVDTPPEPLRAYETPYYRFRWDRTRARQSQEYIRAKWRMANLFDVMGFVEEKHGALKAEAVLQDGASPFESDQWPAVISA
jgi:hypothetical protein